MLEDTNSLDGAHISTVRALQKVNRNIQGVPQSQAAANPRHQEEEKKDTDQRVQNKQTNAREAHRRALSSPSEVIKMLK